MWEKSEKQFDHNLLIIKSSVDKNFLWRHSGQLPVRTLQGEQ
jgi:hypothetical protein